jgi:hypothetical protein
VQPLKNHKNPLSILGIDADAVVAHGKKQCSPSCLHDTRTTGGLLSRYLIALPSKF